MTLNSVMTVIAHFSPNSTSGPIMSKVVEVHPILTTNRCSPPNLSFPQ